MIEPKERIRNLTNLLLFHRYMYYVLAEPIISDYEYDMLEKDLVQLETEYPEFKRPDSPTDTIGADMASAYSGTVRTMVDEYLLTGEMGLDIHTGDEI